MFTSDFIWIILRQAKNKKKYRRHKIDVKFSAESIPFCQNIYIYIDLHLKILDFLLIFDFLASPYFRTPILRSYLDSTGNFTRDIVPWKFIQKILHLIQIKIEKQKKIEYDFSIFR